MYEETKDMTTAERVAYTNRKSLVAIKELGLEKYFVNPEYMPTEI
jgi:hypothetical protein